MISLTMTSGADAPADRPSVAISPMVSQSISAARWTRMRLLRAGSQRHFDEALGVGRIRRADDDEEIAAGSGLLHHFLAVGRGVADRIRRRVPCRFGKALLQPRDDAGRVVDRERRLRDKAEIVGIGRLVGVGILDRLDQRDSPSGSWPIVPITSGWPAWPISTTWRPSLLWRIACLCTFETSGQVASR